MAEDFEVSFQQEMTVAVKQEESFMMRKADWVRLRGRVEKLKKQRREFAAAAWAFVGVGVSAVLAMLTWAPAYAALTEMQRVNFAWVWPALVAVAAAGAVFSVGGFWGAHVMKDAASETANSVCTYMDEVYDVRDLIST